MFNVSGSQILSPRIKVTHDQASGAVAVADFFTKRHHGGPVKGKVETDNGNRTTFTWIVQATNQRNQSAKLSFRLTYYKNGEAPIVTMQAVGYTNADRAQGRCAVS